jgi:hypothetical protein
VALHRKVKAGFLFPALAFGAVFAVSLLCLELLLRSAPSLFPPRYLNHAFSRYGTFPGGIYFEEPLSESYFMFPRDGKRASWNGYFWDHRTDGYGFRNPEGGEGKETLLLGDSIVYGHGVEEEDTAAHFLRERHGHGVYNMSRQGDSLYQHYLLLRLYLEEFRPRLVVLFFFLNDLHDIESRRSGDEIRRRPEIEDFDYGKIRAGVEAGGRKTPSPIANLPYRLASLRLLKGLLTDIMGRIPSPAAADGALPPYLAPYYAPERFELLAEYYRVMLADMKERCRRSGAELALVNLSMERVLPPAALPALEQADTLLRTITSDLMVEYAETSALFRDCEGCFLKNDGHLTAEGHEKLASFLHERLLSK